MPIVVEIDATPPSDWSGAFKEQQNLINEYLEQNGEKEGLRLVLNMLFGAIYKENPGFENAMLQQLSNGFQISEEDQIVIDMKAIVQRHKATRIGTPPSTSQPGTN